MRILVTGGAGYIGSQTCKALACSGFEPITFDNLSTGHSWAVRWGPLVNGDLADTQTLNRALRDFRPEAVIHFAGSAYIGESLTDPAKYYRNNVVNTINLLDAMREHGIGDIVFSSTCATYGVPNYIPIREDHPQQPVNPYGESKLAIEKALRWHAQAYGLRVVCLRYFNAAGADPDGELGEEHDPETHLLPLAIGVASGRRTSVKVLGCDYSSADGTCVRDYTHVSDIAVAHGLTLARLRRAEAGTVASFNLGTGIGHSVREVIAAVQRVSGRHIPVVESGRRIGDPAILLADSALSRTELGWQPRFMRLDDIVETAWKWEIRHRTKHSSLTTTASEFA